MSSVSGQGTRHDAVPMRERLVEVIVDLGDATSPRWRYASGLLVNERSLLTAAHVLTDAVKVTIRGPDKAIANAAVDLARVGDPDTLDLALLEVPDMTQPLPSLPVGEIDRGTVAVVEGCWTVGYPAFMEVQRAADGLSVRETAQVSGSIATLSGLAEGLLYLQVTAAPRELPASGSIGESPWSGMSGAPVFARDALVGIIIEASTKRGPATLTVAPLALLRDTRRAPPNVNEWWASLGVADPSELVRLPEDPEATAERVGSSADATLPPPPGVESLPGDSTAIADKIEWVSDGPARRDLLNRKPVADMLARRLRRLSSTAGTNEIRESASFLIHLDGRWGSGKSSILNFLKEDLEGGESPWLVVEFNAWQQARSGPAWWALLTALRHSVLQGLGPIRRWRLRIADAWHRGRATGAPYALAMLLLLAIAVGLLLAIGPAKVGSAKPGEVGKAVAAVVTAAGAVWAGALLVGRFVLWDSPTGARLFEQSNRNPMTYLRDHFAWTVSRVGRPVVFFIDDLDRCDQADVVEVLEGIQTLIRDTGGSGSSAGPFFVVAADGGWMRVSYDERYQALAHAVEEPGQALGHLFLEKLFQLTVRVPDLSAASQKTYMSQLLESGGSDDSHGAESARVLEAIEGSRTQAEVHSAWGDASPAVREIVAADAVAKLTDEAVEARTEHHLQKFAYLLDRNPRRMKRFLNLYTAELVTSGLEQQFPSPEELALWTIVRVRWPLLATELSTRPELIECVGGTRAMPDDLEVAVAKSLRLRDIRALVNFEHGGPLTPERIQRLTSGPDGT